MSSASVNDAPTWQRLLDAMREEGIGWSYFGKFLADVATVPCVRARMDMHSFVTGFVGVSGREVLGAHRCCTCEEVVEKVCGKGNFTGLAGKVAIVTGASNGLGLENARCLMKYGCHVVWAVRSLGKAEAALKGLEAREGKFHGKATILRIELSDLTTIKPFVEAFLALNLPLHYLICNAGIMAPTEWIPSPQGFELMFATNNLSHFLLTELLMPRMEETAKIAEVRIVVLSSVAGACCRSVDPDMLPCPREKYHEFAEYGVTKALDCLHAQHLQRQLEGKNIVACAVHPGIIGTGLGQGNQGLTSFLYGGAVMSIFRKSVEKGAATTLHCALSPEVAGQVRGGASFFFNCAPQAPLNAMSPGLGADVAERCYARMLELARPYM
uniref:Protochlorophyllide reductase n=1 Tax=Zooxanthella nutricula TaxID=1333877 RepID=A0A7S2J0L4_9DINO